MDDAVRPVQLFTQVLAWSRVERRRWSWLGLTGRLGEYRAGDEVTPATNRQSREPIFIMHPLNWLMCGPFPGAGIAIRAAKAVRPGSLAEWGRPLSRHPTVRLIVLAPALARGRPCRSAFLTTSTTPFGRPQRRSTLCSATPS